MTNDSAPSSTQADSRKHLVLMHAHCHAPTCLKVELWNNDTGELLCRQEPARIYEGALLFVAGIA